MKNKIYEDFSLLLRRANITFIVIGVLFVLLVLYFWKIQILEHKQYWERSEANRIREIILPAQRGLIYDRNEELLATNVASFKVSIIREDCPDIEATYRKVSELLDLSVDIIRERVDKYASLPEFQPIVIKDDLTMEEVARIESRKVELPELIIQSEPKRNYPHDSCAAHVIGYLQEVSQADIQAEDFKHKRIGDLIGKTGIEKEYESYMAGREGRLLDIVDSLGRKKGEYSRIEPEKGKDVTLTIDLVLQKKAEEILEGREGAVVVLSPSSGEILALASYPNFDPNKFINRFSPEEWIDLVNSQKYPLENRAIRGLYSPGSIFKLVMSLAALDSKAITEYTTFYCSGSVVIYGHPFACWFEGGHGSMNLYNGIRNSCNVYFYQLGKKLDINTIADYARAMGLGKRTNVDLHGEKAGLVPDPKWKRQARNLPWYPGETISVAIGQGPLQVTPLQIASLTAVIANRGRKIRPHLLLAGTEAQTKVNAKAGAETGYEPYVQIDRSDFEKVIRGMWKSVNEEGTSRGTKIIGFDICGKTGSTQVVSRETADELAKAQIEIKTHSWFSGFAPKEQPQVVVTIIIEHGGMGGATAAPLARQLFQLYRERYDR